MLTFGQKLAGLSTVGLSSRGAAKSTAIAMPENRRADIETRLARLPMAKVAPPPTPAHGAFMPAAPTPHGPLRWCERRYDASHLHGTIRLGGAKDVRGQTVATLALDEAFDTVDFSRVLFVDTETTGLHHGAGTLPFLTGLAWFEGDALTVQQLFLGRPGEEGPLLRTLAERVRDASALVSFNGKSFDWPLLRTRLIMNRVSVPPLPPHLDLLHCSRRLFKRRLQGTRLQELEAQVLQFHREDDVASALIPTIYFDWLRHGRVGVLPKVLLHNELDVVSMAALLYELCRRIDEASPHEPAEDVLSLAQVLSRAGVYERAEPLALAAAAAAQHHTTALDAWRLAAQLASRRCDFAANKERLLRALQFAGPEEAPALSLALSRVCEHRLKDRVLAYEFARAAAAAEDADAHRRRLTRLQPAASASSR